MFENWKKPNEIRKLIIKTGLNPDFFAKIEHKATVERWFYAMLKKSVATFHPDVTNYDSHADFVEMNEAKEKLLQLPFFMILQAVNPVKQSRKRANKTEAPVRSHKEKQLLAHFALGRHHSNVKSLTINRAFPISNLDVSIGAKPIFSVANFMQFFELQLSRVKTRSIRNELQEILIGISDNTLTDLNDEKVFKRLAFLYQKYASEVSSWIDGNQPVRFDATRGILFVDETGRYQIQPQNSLCELEKVTDNWSRKIIVGSVRWPSFIHRLKKFEVKNVNPIGDSEQAVATSRRLGLSIAVDLELFEILEPSLMVGNHMVAYCPDSDILFFPVKIAGEPKPLDMF